MAADADRFAVVWQNGQDLGGVPETGGSRVVGRDFGASGSPQNPEVRLSRAEEGQQAHPQVAVEANGDFVAAWAEVHDDGADVKAARFSAQGSPLGPEMEMKTAGEDNVGVYVAAFPDGALAKLRQTQRSTWPGSSGSGGPPSTSIAAAKAINSFLHVGVRGMLRGGNQGGLMKKTVKKLALNRETLTHLTSDDLPNVMGAATQQLSVCYFSCGVSRCEPCPGQ